MLPRGDGRPPKKGGRNDYREAFLRGTGAKQASEEVLARTGLSRNKFKAGRRRLLSSAELLSRELHGAARDFLRRAS